MKKIIVLVVLIASAMSSVAQATYKQERSTFSVILRAGLPQSETKNFYKKMYSLGLRREFSAGKFISLNATASYNSLVPKRNISDMNLVNIGGGVTLYPKYLINKILGNAYDDEVAKTDHFYLDQSYEININKSGLYGVGNVLAYRSELSSMVFKLGRKLSFSPKAGGVMYFRTNDSNFYGENILGYIYLGLGLSFKR